MAYHMDLDPGLEFERFGVVSMEGYLRPGSGGRGLWLGGIQLWAGELPQDVGAHALVRIHGRVEGGRWLKPERIDYEDRGGGAFQTRSLNLRPWIKNSSQTTTLRKR